MMMMIYDYIVDFKVLEVTLSYCKITMGIATGHCEVCDLIKRVLVCF